ncbi:MAG: methionine biosynthesis protein MetW [Rhodospirillales bacterium]|jgi:methionine biosynthesis protein MetW|nr:methionine biosynthesis protein MetW [Rhodospirillales bacterium]
MAASADAPAAARPPIRIDLQLIADMIAPATRVLDVGCGDGQLLDYLVHVKGVDGRGIELSSDGVHACVSAGLSVIQGDAETDLPDYPDGSFDYVVLSQTLQAMREPKATLQQLCRIGRHAIISMPNFAHWRLRWLLLARGRMPVAGLLAHQWYDTPNIHLCTIRDFLALAADLGIAVESGLYLRGDGVPRRLGRDPWLANLLGEQAIFLIQRARPFGV